MKICVITNLYPPFVRGGAEYLVHQLVLELFKQGHRVSVITSAPWQSLKSFKPQLQEELGVRVYRFYPLNLYYYLNASRVIYPVRWLWHIINLFNCSDARRVKSILKKVKPDLVISSNLMGISFLPPRVIAHLNIKHLHILHDVQLLHPSGLFIWGKKKLSLAMRCYQLCTRWLFKKVSVVVSPSEWLLNEHITRGFFKKCQKYVLPNPIPQALNKSRIKNAEPPFELLYDGQLAEHKGARWLIEALKEYQRSDFVLHLVVRGDKLNFTKIQEFIEGDKRFAIHWSCTQREIDEYYDQSHLVIVPSLCYENSPVSISKSLMVGTSVLASDIGGIPELIKVGETGWLFKPGDKDDFIKKLNWCLDNPNKLLETGLQASKEFTSRTLVNYTKKIIEVSEVIDN
jgi:glycosyltransferase involved in cell wall biosynthesis